MVESFPSSMVFLRKLQTVALDSVCELGWQSLRPQCCEVDAFSPVSFVNFRNPIPPQDQFSGSLLHNMTWPKWDTGHDRPSVFLFSDAPRETYGLIQDTYWEPNMELLAQVQVEIGP